MPEELKKIVTDASKLSNDPLLLKELEKQGVDKDGVEFVQDYGRRVPGISSPYAKFYRDLNSNKRFAVISELPMVDHIGAKVEVGWNVDGEGWVSKNNVFRARVNDKGTEIEVRNNQPDGTKAGQKLTYSPQLFINEKEAEAVLGPVLLDVDPINGDYTGNVIEWDYGEVKRWLRLIEGRVHGYWLRPLKFNKTLRVVYNQAGDFKLKLGQWKTSEDEETVPAALNVQGFQYVLDYKGAKYTLVSDSLTFYPDAHPESTSVDGWVVRISSLEAWATIKAGAGTHAGDSDIGSAIAAIYAETTSNKWNRVDRAIFLFDTSALTSDATISAATLSIRGGSGRDDGISPTINIYSSNPASNTSLTTADFSTLGSTAFSSAIAFASWSTNYNDFALNASGLAAISKTGISKFGVREGSFDGGAGTPTWGSGWVMYFTAYFAEQGTGFKPKLVITYIYTQVKAVGGGSVSIGGALTNIYRQVKSVGGELTIAGALTSIYRQLMNVGGASGGEGSDTLTLRPNGAGDETSLSIFPDLGEANWEDVCEEIPDEDTSYVWRVPASYERDIYALPNHTTETGTITSVKIYIRCRQYSGQAYAKPSLKIDSSIVDGTEIALTPSYTTYSQEWSVNPVDSQAWEWSDIDALQVGVALKGTAISKVYCTQVYVEVDYVPTTPWISGSLNRLIKIGVGGAVTTAGALNLLIKKGVGGTVGIAGALSSIYRQFMGVGGGEVSASGALNRLILVGVGGAVTMAGAVTGILKHFVSAGGAVTMAGTLGRLIKRGVGSGSITIAGALSQCFKMAVGQGAVGIAGALTYWWPRVLHAIAFTAAYRKARAVTSLYRKFKAFTAAYRKLKIITAGYRAAKAVTSLYRKVKAITRGG